ncbi:MAG: site-specific integrase [Proteobacteria bacterium]|nr:site-specific integrase [Pseudomonadota bacterium]
MGIRKYGDKWGIDYYDLNHIRRREIIGTNHQEAKKILEARLGDKARGKNPDIPWSKRITFEEFIGDYLAYSKENKRAWKRDLTSLNHLKPFLGKKRLDQINPFDIEQYKQERKKEVSRRKKAPAPGSINRELALLKNIFNKAIQWGKAGTNPLKGVKFLKEPEGRIRYLTEEEMTKLLTACQPNQKLHLIVFIALNTGMRKSEILKLKWDQIDWTRKAIVLTETKSGRRRDIYMGDFLTEKIREFRVNEGNGEYVFTGKLGKPFSNVRKSFEGVLKEVGIQDFKFHDLRHTFASHLVMEGIDLVTVKELLGHRSFNMTLRYSHLSPDHKKSAIERMSAKLEGEMVNSDRQILGRRLEYQGRVVSLSN